MSGNEAVKIVGVGSQVSRSPHRFVFIMHRPVRSALDLQDSIPHLKITGYMCV